ncbi:hypothetical protein CI105_03880 [Candidatus Izimaplasma bacterium ZiA1]|uniref:hypothetical protein n=1 Tax=Candidatus Izimoplasma sp. ZiA1 TaxID=2024899 RepID=UPI000BAA7DC4|nr:hypothetical protein CI105_03880 [Candidatus Izimaplasma bacterium ZiA1]
MFRSNRVSTLEWMILIVLMAIPVVNIIAWVILFFGVRTSGTIRNFLMAILVFIILSFIFGIFTGILDKVFNFIF